MKKFLTFLAKIWELPQEIVGLVIATFFFDCKLIGVYDGIKIYGWNYKTGGMSLGSNIFTPFEYLDGSRHQENHIRHEYGHTIQSHILGPLYLIVIALPSLTWAGLGGKYREKTGKSYYSFYTEAWAEKLGKVNREG